MKRFLLYSIYQVKAVLFLSLIFSYLGFKYYFTGVQEIFPIEETNVVEISAKYSGATAVEIERRILIPIENALQGVKGYSKVTSVSSNNEGKVYFAIAPKYRGPISEIIEDIRSQIKRMNNLPTDMKEIPIVKLLKYNNMPFVYVGMHGSKLGENLSLIDVVEDAIRDVRGISFVSSIGFDDLEILVNVDSERLNKYEIDLNDVKEAIKKRNINLSGGNVDTDERVYLVRTSEQYKTLEDIENTVIEANDFGNVIRLKDIADVNWNSEEVYLKTMIDTDDAVFFEIYKTESSNLLTVKKDLTRAIDRLKSKYNIFKNGDVSLTFLGDKTEFLKKRYFLVNLFFVISLVWIFLFFLLYSGISTAVWSVLSYVLTLGVIFSQMSVTNTSINIVSLYALFVMTFIFSNVFLWLFKEVLPPSSNRFSAEEFAEKISHHVYPILTLLSVFVMFFACFYFFDLDSVKMIRLIFKISLFTGISTFVINFFIVPPLFFHYSRHSTRFKNDTFIRLIESPISALDRFVQKIMDYPIKFILKRFIYGVTFISLVIIFLPKSTFPKDYNSMTISFILNNNNSIDSTKLKMKEINQQIKKIIGLDDLRMYTTIGSLKPLENYKNQNRSYWANITTDNYSYNYSEIKKISQFLKDTSLKYSIDSFSINENDIYTKAEKLKLRLVVIGDDLDVFYDIRKDAIDILKDIDTVKGIDSLYEDLLPTYELIINRERAIKLGVSVSSILNVLSSSFQGYIATTANGVIAKSVDVKIRLDKKELKLNGMGDFKDVLSHILVMNKRGAFVSVDNFLDINESVSYPFIFRYNLQRMMYIDSEIENNSFTDLRSTSNFLKSKVDYFQKKYKDVIFQVVYTDGDFKKLLKNSILFLVTIFFLSFVILVMLFKSYWMSFSVFMSTFTTISLFYITSLVLYGISFLTYIPEVFYQFNFFNLIALFLMIAITIGNSVLLFYDIRRFFVEEGDLKRSIYFSMKKRYSFFVAQFLLFTTLSFSTFIASLIYGDNIVSATSLSMLLGFMGVILSTLSYSIYYMVLMNFRKQYIKDDLS